MHDYEMIPRKWDQAINYLIEKHIANGRHVRVENKKDWELVRDIFRVWKAFNPDDYKDFVKSQESFRESKIDDYASSGTKKSAVVRHLAEIPGIFVQMMTKFYPEQNFTSEFGRKLVKEIPELKIPEKI